MRVMTVGRVTPVIMGATGVTGEGMGRRGGKVGEGG